MTNIAKPVEGAKRSAGIVESVADILERELDTVIKEWLARVEKESDLTHISLNYEGRHRRSPMGVPRQFPHVTPAVRMNISGSEGAMGED